MGTDHLIENLETHANPDNVVTSDGRHSSSISIGDILVSYELAEAHLKDAEDLLTISPHLRESVAEHYQFCNNIIGLGTFKTSTPGSKLQVAIASASSGDCIYPNPNFAALHSQRESPKAIHEASHEHRIMYNLLSARGILLALQSVSNDSECPQIVRDAARYMTTGRRVPQSGAGCLAIIGLISILIFTQPF